MRILQKVQDGSMKEDKVIRKPLLWKNRVGYPTTSFGPCYLSEAIESHKYKLTNAAQSPDAVYR